jgi:hypothetical protein
MHGLKNFKGIMGFEIWAGLSEVALFGVQILWWEKGGTEQPEIHVSVEMAKRTITEGQEFSYTS